MERCADRAERQRNSRLRGQWLSGRPGAAYAFAVALLLAYPTEAPLIYRGRRRDDRGSMPIEIEIIGIVRQLPVFAGPFRLSTLRLRRGPQGRHDSAGA